MILEKGRVCRKVRGRDAGDYCVVLKEPEGNKVMVDGKKVKRGEVSIRHLEPLPVVLKIRKGSKTETIVKALEKEGF
ncbi:MAG: 50S ribosomal protein L14e [Candidatus Altiarchaeales archaeon ex4484_2]|nr:MAG: 50S ribosomal protein L14e [Candidatus Altiarchaeales archaeon ex4484_2]